MSEQKWCIDDTQKDEFARGLLEKVIQVSTVHIPAHTISSTPLTNSTDAIAAERGSEITDAPPTTIAMVTSNRANKLRRELTALLFMVKVK